MWGIFIGIALGVLQVWALSKLGGMILGDKVSAKITGLLLFIGKTAVIVIILYLMSTVSLTHLIWTAGGMLIGLVSVSVYLLSRRKKTDGEERNDG